MRLSKITSSSYVIVNFEHIVHINLALLPLTSKKNLLAVYINRVRVEKETTANSHGGSY